MDTLEVLRGLQFFGFAIAFQSPFLQLGGWGGVGGISMQLISQSQARDAEDVQRPASEHQRFGNQGFRYSLGQVGREAG